MATDSSPSNQDVGQRQGVWPQFGVALGLSLAVILLTGLLANLPILVQMENVTRDWRFRQRSTQPMQVPINIIEIDDASLSAPDLERPLHLWGPFHARVFENLRKSGAKAIGFDVIQPVTWSGILENDPDQPQAVIISQTPQMVLAYTQNVDAQGKLKESKSNDMLLAALALGGGREGYANTTADSDGVIRRFTVTDGTGKDASPSFALSIAMVAAGQKPRWENNAMVLGDKRTVIDAERRGYIDYRGPNGTFPRISYKDYLAHPETYRKQIQGSICLIGITSWDLLDSAPTPLVDSTVGSEGSRNNYMHGVEIQANIVHTLLAGSSLKSSGIPGVWLCVALATLMVVPLYWLPRVSLIVPAALLITGFWVALCHWAFINQNWLMPIVAPVAFVPLVAPVVAMLLNQSLLFGVRLRQEHGNRRWLEDVFGRYVSPKVLEHMLNTPGAVSLGGKRKTLTVLFSDIRGFTTMSDGMEPEQVTRFLNDYLETMVEIIFENGGTVDKYLGDGIMVVYNWPLEQKDHADRAVRTAVQMVRAVEANREKWAAMGLPTIQIGVGIHTGPAVVGNIGASRRMEQTAIGDTINVASRMEGLCKTVGKSVGSSILLSDMTRRAMLAESGDQEADYRIIEAGTSEIRGHSVTLQVFAVL